MQIARSNPRSNCFAFDLKSLLRQIVDVVAEFRGAPSRSGRPTVQVLSLPVYQAGFAGTGVPHAAFANRRLSAYSPRWG